MEEKFKFVLGEALRANEMSAPELAREIGLDKAYFVDLLAGRKKTVSAAAFMLVAQRFGFDPWDVAGLTPPAKLQVNPPLPVKGNVQLELPRQKPNPSDIPPVERVRRISVSDVVEEGAFRSESSLVGRQSVEASRLFPEGRQTLYEVRGADYEDWGIPSGTLIQSVIFDAYDAVASAGRLVVIRTDMNGLREHVVRRVAIDAQGVRSFRSAAGKSSGMSDRSMIVGLVMQLVYPSLF